MKIAVTGATGLVGSTICKKLIQDKHHVIALTRQLSNLSTTESRYFTLEDSSNIDLKNIDVIVHSAAYLPKDYSDSKEITKCLMNNTVATLNLIEAAASANVSTFIYLSSGNIYDPNSTYIAFENSAIYPSMRAPYYLASKAAADSIVEYIRHTCSMRIVTLRPTSIYGVGMGQAGLIPRLVNKLKNNILTNNDIGNYKIDLVNVNDVSWMINESIINSDISGIFNVGGGVATSIYNVAKILAGLLKIKYSFKEENFYEVSHAMLDITKAKQIGYNPCDLVSGLKSYIESL